MLLPARFRSEFSSSTLTTIERHASRFRARSPLFFRSAHTGNVTENERRTFQPIVIADAAKIVTARCTCTSELRSGDLCGHVAVLLDSMLDGDGLLPAARFEPSVWR